MPGSARVYLWGSPAWVKGDPHLGPILLMIRSGCFWAEVRGKASRGNWDQLQRFKSRGFRIFSWFRGEREPWWRDSWSENTESSEEKFLWKKGGAFLIGHPYCLFSSLPFPSPSLFANLASVFPPGKKKRSLVSQCFLSMTVSWCSPLPAFFCIYYLSLSREPPFPFTSSDHLNPAIPLTVALQPPILAMVVPTGYVFTSGDWKLGAPSKREHGINLCLSGSWSSMSFSLLVLSQLFVWLLEFSFQNLLQFYFSLVNLVLF